MPRRLAARARARARRRVRRRRRWRRHACVGYCNGSHGQPSSQPGRHHHRRITRYRTRDRPRPRRRRRQRGDHRPDRGRPFGGAPPHRGGGAGQGRNVPRGRSPVRGHGPRRVRDRRALWRPRHPRQQRRRLAIRQRGRHDAGAVVRGHRHQSHRCLQRLPRGAAATEAARRRLHHQHQQPGREERVSECGGVLRVEVRAERVQRSADAGSASRQYPGDLRDAGIGGHRFLRRRSGAGRRLEDRRRTTWPAWCSICCVRIRAACRAASNCVRRSRRRNNAHPCLSSTSTTTRSNTTKP